MIKREDLHPERIAQIVADARAAGYDFFLTSEEREASLRDALFCERPVVETVVARIGGEVAGFAIFFHNFSTFLGKRGLYLEDLFVKPEFRGAGTSSNRFFVDVDTLSIGKDGVVRYVLVVRSPGGAENVSFEGIRCETREQKAYAFGQRGGTWSPAREAPWRLIEAREVNRHHVVLYTEAFCVNGKTPPRAARGGWLRRHLFGGILNSLLTLSGLLLLVVLVALHVRGGILIGLISTTALAVVLERVIFLAIEGTKRSSKQLGQFMSAVGQGDLDGAIAISRTTSSVNRRERFRSPGEGTAFTRRSAKRLRSAETSSRNGVSPMKWMPNIIIRATQKKMMSKPVTRTSPG